MKIALVGTKAVGRTFAAFYLKKQHGFKMVRMNDGVIKFIRYMYGYGKYQRPTWERKIDFYDALYKIDPDVHVNYLLRRLDTTTRDVVVDDVRYVHEVLRLKSEGFLIIRISGDRRKKIHPSKSLREAAAGAILLHEQYQDAKNPAYTVDYSVFNGSREGTRKSLDEILDIERSKPV